MKKKNPRKDVKHAFYRALGTTLGRWYMIEVSLFRIFNRLAGGQTPINSAIFHAVLNTRTRLEMLHELAVVALRHEPTRLKALKALIEKTNKAAKKRNHLAHYMPMLDLTKRDLDKIWRLQPSIYDITQRAQKGPQYTTEGIEKTSAEFDALVKELASYYEELLSWSP